MLPCVHGVASIPLPAAGGPQDVPTEGAPPQPARALTRSPAKNGPRDPRLFQAPDLHVMARPGSCLTDLCGAQRDQPDQTRPLGPRELKGEHTCRDAVPEGAGVRFCERRPLWGRRGERPGEPLRVSGPESGDGFPQVPAQDSRAGSPRIPSREAGQALCPSPDCALTERPGTQGRLPGNAGQPQEQTGPQGICRTPQNTAQPGSAP